MQQASGCFDPGRPMMPVAEARALLESRLEPIAERQRVHLDAALGRILAEDVVSAVTVPPSDNSAVDGFALRHADLDPKGPSRLPVTGRVAAGQVWDRPLAAGGALRIFTGAAVPEGVDTVVMQEDCRLDGDAVIVPAGIARGANLRKAGENVVAGDRVLAAGTRLRPQDIGMAASVGLTDLTVWAPLRVAVFSTGDEIRDPPAALGPGCIYDANRYTLTSLLRGVGCVVTDLGILPDRADAIRRGLEDSARDHHILVTSGGVSLGEEDHVKAAVEALGSLYVWRLAVKPGRPIALGQVGAATFVGLPGNPVAAMVTFLCIIRPLLLRMSGATDVDAPRYRVTAAFDHNKKVGRREWLRARLVPGDDGPQVVKFPHEGSGILRSMVESDGLVELPEEQGPIRAGMPVDYLPFSEVLG